MAGHYKTGEIEWLPLTIYGASFLRFIFEEYNCGLGEGIVMMADDEKQARQFIEEYCKRTTDNGCKISKWNQRSEHLENYCCGFLNMQKKMKEEEIIEFLAEEGFLPVVVCGGILPDYLRNGRYIFRLKKEDVESVSTRQFEDKIADFRAYVVGNIPEVCGILGSLDRSMAIGEFRGNHYEKKIFKTFIGVARIYARYLQKTKTESEVWEFFQKYVKEAEKRIRKMPEFGSSEELTEMISSMVWDYISANKQVVLTEKTMLTGEMYEALKKDIFILFDDEYYYFPPRLLMTICEPLLQTSSEPELKKHLREGGVLYCNSADYTVKKNIMTVYGTKERPRFLWVHKEFLLSPDNLRLEDIFVDNENEKEEDDNE